MQARTGLSRSTIYLRLDQGYFPQPISLGSRAVGWIKSVEEEWIHERIEASLYCRRKTCPATFRPSNSRS